MDSPTPPRVVLKVEHLTKRFPGAIALDDVGLTVRQGEVLAVVGENGAGKSTLMKILAGVERPDAGSIEFDGNFVQIDTVKKALELGIVLIHQELNLVDNFDIGANIFLGREPRRGPFFNRRLIAAESRRLLASLALPLSPHTSVEHLSIGHRQMVEIAKALSVNARILIMDEPTSSLSQHEADTLFGIIRDLRQRGVSIIYVSHRLAEVQRLADRVVVLRDGKVTGELSGTAIRPDRMVSLMVGRNVSLFAGQRPRTPGEALLEVKDLRTAENPRIALSFTVRRHEIVGIAGLVGAGRTALLQSLFGLMPPRGGMILVDGKQVEHRHPSDAIRSGLGFVPEERKAQGLILEMATRDNISLPALSRWAGRGGFIQFRRERQSAVTMVQKLQVKPADPNRIVQNLSGGNQQKIVLAKWLLLKPRLLLLDEPTRGVDVGAKEEIYHLIEEAAENGTAVLFASSDLPEILGLADRILVMHQGKIAGQLTKAEATEEMVMHLATGESR